MPGATSSARATSFSVFLQVRSGLSSLLQFLAVLLSTVSNCALMPNLHPPLVLRYCMATQRWACQMCEIYCVYVIRLGDMAYVGFTHDVITRLSSHEWLLQNDIHFNKHFQEAYNDRGDTGLAFGVIELLDIGATEEDAKKRETYHIRTMGDKVFNIIGKLKTK